MLTEETVAALQAKYKRVCAIRRDDVEFVIRAPTRGEYKAFRSALHTPATQADAQEDLVRDLVVWCADKTDGDARLAFDALLDEYPALCENKAVSGEVSKFTGLEFAAQGKASALPAKPSGQGPTSSQTG
jgi:hypothetical protein